MRLAALVLTFLPLLTAAPADTKAGKIERLIEGYVKDGRFQGSVLVADKGDVIFKKGFGFANIELQAPNTPDTKFRLGSVTKQFTAMLVMQLVSQGKLRLEGKIGDYVPDYPRRTGDRITIHQLLSHQSGIPNYTNPEFFEKQSRLHFSPIELARTFWDKPLDFEPGARYSYSNSGYHVLGIVIEKVTGKPYEQVLRENILTPLGMRDTGYDHTEAILPQRAAGYQKNAGVLTNAPFLDMSIPYSAGGMYSTVEDLAKWAAALYTEQLLPARYRDRMFTPQVRVPPGRPGESGAAYGYGWLIENWKLAGGKREVRVIGHGGGIPGFSSMISRLPDDRRLIVLLSNQIGGNWNDLPKKIAAILYGEAP